MRFGERLLSFDRPLLAYVLLAISTLEAWSLSVHFDWDLAKSERNRQERGFGFNFAILIFDGDTMEWPDARRDYGEARVRAVGEVDGIVLHVVFTDRGDIRRIISARVANRKERNQWHVSR